MEKKKYGNDLLEKLQERVVIEDYKGAKIQVKLLPDCDDKGAMDPRLYHDQKKMFTMMKLMPKRMKQKELSLKDLLGMRKMFNEVKSIPVVTRDIKIEHTTVKATDGYDIPVRIYRSDATKAKSPVLYYIHGGGFFAGSPDVVEEAMKMFVDNTDLCVVSVDYRLAPEHPYPLGHEDCFSVLKWMYEAHEQLDIDPKNIFVGGDSAGGNLTQYCTTRSYESDPQMVKGQLLLYPTINMCGIEDEFFHWSIDAYEFQPKQKSGLETMLGMFGGMSKGMEPLLGVKDAENEYLNPYTRDPKKNPPTFITVGEHDYLKVESLAYAAKLTDAGVETETIVYKGFGHAYLDNIGVYPQSEDCVREMGKFVLKHSS